MIKRTALEIAELCGATLEGDGDRTLVGPASLREARSDQVSFLGNHRYRPDLETTRAGAVLLGRDVETSRRDLALLRCDNPNSSFSRVIEAFLETGERPAPGIHPAAVVDPTADVADTAWVGPGCVVGPGAKVGGETVLHGNVCVGANARIGERSEIHPGVVLYPSVEVGDRCTILAGTVVGSDGFGFEHTREGWQKIPQCGTVVIEDDVEVGANCAIDRGRFGATRIGAGAKLDNLVHVAHNVEVGPCAMLVAQVGISGSSRIGKGAVLAGQVGVAGHVEIGDGARIAAQSGVSKDLPGGKEYFGSPVRPRREAWRLAVLVGRLPEMSERLAALERRVRELEGEEP